MALPEPSASSENLGKIIKGLRAVVDEPVLTAALIRYQLDQPMARAQRVALAVIRSMIEDLSQQLNDPLLMTRAFAQLNYSRSFLGTTFLSSTRTVLDVVQMAQRYMHLGTDLGSIGISLEGSQARVQVQSNPAFQPSRQQMDSMLYAMLRTLQSLGVQQLVAHLPAPQADVLKRHYRQLFKVPIQFNSTQECYQLSFPRIELSRALDWEATDIGRLARRERRLIRNHDAHDWAGSVMLLLPVLLRRGDASIERCATLLALSSRSLQRRLADEGQPFSRLLEQCRRQLCMEYLAAGYASETVALLIGYRQTGQFFRSYRRWFGHSPGDFQRAQAVA